MTGSTKPPRIVWLRRDLRLADQPAFCAAAEQGPVIPVYVLDDQRAGDRRLGGASRWWLHGSLEALDKRLRDAGSRLVLRRGDSVEQLVSLAREAGASGIDAIRHYEHWWREAEEQLASQLELHLHDGNYLAPPGTATTGSGQPFKIYTPFARALMPLLPLRDPLPEPKLRAPSRWPQSDRLADWHLLPTKPDWAAGFREAWVPGEDEAQERLEHFVSHAKDYANARNMPSVDGSSRLSPRLHWGELSPTQVWHALEGEHGAGADTFRGEIVWRDYAQNVILQSPRYPEESYRDGFARFPWRDPAKDKAAAADLRAWQRGRTGYPIVDAGMRQLWTTGWMHNRVRMIAASFLIKHLLIDWRHGERWFWDTLVDADYANNGVNWQWVSGSGVDSSMFTRIMAPLSQSDKFDAGDYIREWVPELAALSDASIHDPDDEERPKAYPERRIGHREARERALAAYRKVRA
ncbi:deoxyribodipyrimidine photo-lyase [Novosphingobium chloroacetimidivorans]|uniref:Deoxyribodipyrimidine photo-lyase n=1 Tax=Novosphingobium chloroacetimidivorans TaxID=1428314 RepID=A0A7W7KBH3_9SPHN|nr:deoxyribodipyrimidine photo-lyase [Novosphingobium chloroacetimidivorans]MBB4859769.1 deoxyribodipyrimidine photo-lyase [Novosphingobium chloroacetimidivorans]